MTCRDVMASHVSVRRFQRTPIPEEHVEEILWAARRAPTAWGLQPFTVIVVRDEGLRARIAEAVGGQEHVREAPIFLLFAIDYAKLVEAAELLGLRAGRITLGHIAAALVDVGIASSWAMLRAEELGYGAVYIAAYYACRRLAEILSLPKLVIPAVGLSIGVPAERPSVRPRQPREAMVAEPGGYDPRRAAEAIASSGYREKFALAARYTLTPRGYYEKLAEEIIECMRMQGVEGV